MGSSSVFRLRRFLSMPRNTHSIIRSHTPWNRFIGMTGLTRLLGAHAVCSLSLERSLLVWSRVFQGPHLPCSLLPEFALHLGVLSEGVLEGLTA